MDTFLATLTITEFRAFKKALAYLVRAGMTHDAAVTLLVAAITEKRDRQNNWRKVANR